MYFIVFYCEIHLKYCQDTINRQFNSTMENNFAGKTARSLSYPGANSGQFSYPLPNMVHPLEGSVRTGAGKCPEFDPGAGVR